MTQTVGIDLVAVEAVTAAIAEHGERYLSRVYTDAERAACLERPARLAERFAVKEAALKALRPPRDAAVPWRCIELGTGGELVLTGQAAALARDAGLSRFAVSVSAQDGYATAVVHATSAVRGDQ
ncbi:MAG: holo-ACP synthase [Solirubrobacteraceae bacterium]